MWEYGKWSPARNRWTKFFISVLLEMYREQYGKYVLVRNISSSQWLWYIYYDLSSEILVLIRNNIRKLFFLERPSKNDNHIREKITRFWSAENEFALTWVQSTRSARTLSKFRLSGVSEMFFCTLLTSGNLISLAIWCKSFKDYKLHLLYWHMQVWCLKNLLVLITPNCKRNHVITCTYFHLTGLHPLHHRQLQVLPVHLVLLTMVSNDPDSTNSLTNLQGWFGHHSYHSGQTSSMRKWINLARPLANFPRKILKENQRSILQML